MSGKNVPVNVDILQFYQFYGLDIREKSKQYTIVSMFGLQKPDRNNYIELVLQTYSVDNITMNLYNVTGEKVSCFSGT